MNDISRKPGTFLNREILARFETEKLDASTREYLRYHSRRYAYLMEKVERLPRLRILDIGPSFQTALMRWAYPASVVDTLGFHDERVPIREGDRHIDYDLNDSRDVARWPTVTEPYDLVVMAEVLEHVHTATWPVLNCVGSFLKPGGHLIIQTPNAVNLMRRYSTARGVNPHDMIREEQTNPGHFCEFTAGDLRAAVTGAGLEVVELEQENYFGEDGLRKQIYGALCSLLPGQLRDGLTLIARKP